MSFGPFRGDAGTRARLHITRHSQLKKAVMSFRNSPRGEQAGLLFSGILVQPRELEAVVDAKVVERRLHREDDPEDGLGLHELLLRLQHERELLEWRDSQLAVK